MDYLGKLKKKSLLLVIAFAFFRVNALCEFGLRKLPIKISQKTITDSSHRFDQLKEDGE